MIVYIHRRCHAQGKFFEASHVLQIDQSARVFELIAKFTKQMRGATIV